MQIQKNHFISTLIFSAALVFGITATSVWAATRPVTTIHDWNSAVCAADSGNADDFASPSRTDITEFCVDIDPGNFYVAMAIDDTSLNGGNSATVGVRVDLNGDSVFDYLIMAEIGGKVASLQNYSIGSCDAAGVCSNAGNICSGSSCVSGELAVLSGSGTDWPTPFDHESTSCNGNNCATNDTYIELQIPWYIFPHPSGSGMMTAPPTPFFFGDYGSFPSGSGNSAKDQQDAQGNGIACFGSGSCLNAAPSAVTLNLVTSQSTVHTSLPLWSVFGLLALLTAGLFTTRRVMGDMT